MTFMKYKSSNNDVNKKVYIYIYVHGSSQLATDDLSPEGNTKYIQMSMPVIS